MSFINTNNLPPNGYSVRVAETGWVSPLYTGLEDTVREVRKHREANPRFGWPTDEASIRAWVLNSVEGRLRAMPGGAGMQWLVADSPPPDPSFSLPSRQRQSARAELRLAAAVAEPKGVGEQIRDTVAGIGLWLDWFGDSPVAGELATARAAVCVRCPLNERNGNPLQRFNEAAAKEISAIFGSLKHAKLSTPHDEALGVCSACECPMKAKVFAPLPLIVKRLRPEARERLAPECWILSESAAKSD